MENGNGNFTRLKRILVGASGAGMLWVSISLSKEGVGFNSDGAWMGLIIAVSLCCAEFMFNSNYEEMNWTILFLGIGAYLYSIYTNINGFYKFQGMEGNIVTNFSLGNSLGGIFMDVYPELAIAWALKESKIGDLIGNTVKAWKSPENMTTEPSQPIVNKRVIEYEKNNPSYQNREQGRPYSYPEREEKKLTYPPVKAGNPQYQQKGNQHQQNGNQNRGK